MLATLSLADHELFERLIQAMFPQYPSGDPNAHKAEVLSQAIKEKTVSTVMACKDVLSQEPPERMTNFWGTVSLQIPNSLKVSDQLMLTFTSSPNPAH